MQLSGYRWENGTLASGALTVTYAIESFTRASDMHGDHYWIRPQTRADIVKPGEVSMALDGSQGGYGGYDVLWELPFVTRGMVAWLWTDLFESKYSNAATIRTFDRQTNAWRVLNGTALWPDNEMLEGLDNKGGGFVDFPIRFINCTTAA